MPPRIVSDYGFKHLGGQQSHQASWKRSVFEVYQSASVPDDWTPILKDYCDNAGIEYFSSPYDFAATDLLDDYVRAHKIGSGEIDWIETLEYIASKGKPVLLATGACDIGEVQRAVHAILRFNSQLVLMQCNTNYTASAEEFQTYQSERTQNLRADVPRGDPWPFRSHRRAHHCAGRSGTWGEGDRETLHRR